MAGLGGKCPESEGEPCFGTVNMDSEHLRVPHTGGVGSGCNTLWDATIEESFHLITTYGLSQIYPEKWAEREPHDHDNELWPSSTLGKLIKEVYDNGDYDPFGHGKDDDPDPGTIVGEGTHWAMTTILGSHDFPGQWLTEGQ